ncbi:MAG: glycosyltransferase [Actinomycetota bacterium]|nr:glycosyltransferase [Actinomycetota bacterium]
MSQQHALDHAPSPESDLVVLSHLRWTFVWQRPQHLISRLATSRRTWFVEEPLPCAVESPQLRSEEHGNVTRMWLEVPRHYGPSGHCGFDHAVGEEHYAAAAAAAIGEPGGPRTVWTYTPMAMGMAAALQADHLVYDVMDDLASFDGAPEAMRLRHLRVLRDADVVFTGGRSLHRGVTRHRRDHTYLFPSGVEPEHFRSTSRSGPNRTPVAGYVGVIDERLDLDLLSGLAAALPDWRLEIVGPTLKIDPATLPQAPNLSYPGPQPYERLPEVLAGFDVALMPFALNASTRSISPTKTLEYLAAGLPVVSTRVPDVVSDYGHIVDMSNDAAGFAEACRRAQGRGRIHGDGAVQEVLGRQHWDTIAAHMEAILDDTSHPAAAPQGGA